MVRHLHQAHGFAITLWPRHAEIVLQPALGIGALLVTDDADALAAEAAETADDGVIVTELAVTREGYKIFNQRRDVVDGMWPLRMAGHLGFLPGRQPGIEVLE